MIAGHFGFAAAVKSREPETPLWALMLATVWLDVVFVPLYLSGIETAQPADEARAGYGAFIIHADYSHYNSRRLFALGRRYGRVVGDTGRACRSALGKTPRRRDRL